MHSSPSASSSPVPLSSSSSLSRNRGSRPLLEQDDESSSTKTLIFIGTIILLLMTSVSCFATSFIATSLIDWPLGSVVEKRSRLYHSSSEKQDFSLLHAALQREDHCKSETQEQLDRAFGIYAKREIQATVYKAKVRVDMIEVSAAEQWKKIKEDKLQERNSRELSAGGKQKKKKIVENQITPHRSYWNVPQFAQRASKFESHELDMFYANNKHKNGAEQQQQQNGDDNAAMSITSVAAVASAFRNVANFMGTLSRPIREGNSMTYARNTVDKLLYQLRNFEPLQKVISSPQWNPVTGMMTIHDHESKEGKNSPSSSDCPTRHYKKLVLGLSSVSRKKNYLFNTVSALLNRLSPSELKNDVTIVVLDADVPSNKNEDINSIRVAFEKYLNDGSLMIIHREEDHLQHPEMRHGVQTLAHRWADPDDRVWWRSKQVLDVAYLMDWVTSRSFDLLTTESSSTTNNNNERKIRLDKDRDAEDESEIERCKNFGGYFLMLEDDISATKHYSTKILNWVRSALFKARDTKWTVASFYNPWPVKDKEKLPPFKFFGVIGQLFRIHDLPTIVEFLRRNFDQSPLDWLFVDYLKKMNGQMVVHTPSMFQHEGVVSSLEGKTQDGRAVDFMP